MHMVMGQLQEVVCASCVWIMHVCICVCICTGMFMFVYVSMSLPVFVRFEQPSALLELIW